MGVVGSLAVHWREQLSRQRVATPACLDARRLDRRSCKSWGTHAPYVSSRGLGGEHPPWRAQPALWESLDAWWRSGPTITGTMDEASCRFFTLCSAAALVAAIEVTVSGVIWTRGVDDIEGWPGCGESPCPCW